MRRSNMSNINIKLDVQALQALELLGVKFDIIPDLPLAEPKCQHQTKKSLPTLSEMVMAYLACNQPLKGEITFIDCHINNCVLASAHHSRFYQEASWLDWQGRDNSQFKQFTALGIIEGKLMAGILDSRNKYRCTAWYPVTSVYDLTCYSLASFLENIRRWYEEAFKCESPTPQTCDDVVKSLQNASSYIDELEVKLKVAEREALNNLHRYENLHEHVKCVEAERDKANDLCHRMVNSRTYSGWHAYYAMSYVRDNVAWYIESRSAKGRGADARVNLKEFHHAFDESAYFLTRQSIKDEELILKLKELREEMRNFYAILEEMIITIKYSEGNPKQAVARIIKVLDAIL